jgi:hypothetical protein
LIGAESRHPSCNFFAKLAAGDGHPCAAPPRLRSRSLAHFITTSTKDSFSKSR